MVEPREDGGRLPRDDCVAVEAVLPHRVEAGQVEQRPLPILVRRPVHEEGLLVTSLPPPLVESFTHHDTAPVPQTGTVQLAGPHPLHSAVVGREAVRGWAGARVPGRHQPPHHGLEAELRLAGGGGQAEDRGVETRSDVRRRGPAAGVSFTPHWHQADLRVTGEVTSSLSGVTLLICSSCSGVAFLRFPLESTFLKYLFFVQG